jgi:hypothetical protein
VQIFWQGHTYGKIFDEKFASGRDVLRKEEEFSIPR